ncbi:MAG: N-acetyltransferase [Bauldia sp.]|uniref:GNAT family N-acetyltransferase n=1 Tax=Bauldia sp. TaxID=2575872 RepID=UPI001DBB9F8C|nr:GNAT family N-acetyltransferase [Bauldia sp.]MCB1495755.1 N-acetyltransferase [Bauldia sp.]
MTDHSKSEATLTVVSSLNDIARDDWDACANPEGLARRLGPGESSNQHGEIAPGAQPDCEREMPTIGDARSGLEYNPFLSHDFLWSLEESGSATRKTGWLGQHLVLAGADDRPAAILPCYLKSHSMGEYVFDGGWANAFEQAGGRYYPKLQVSVPFTPVTGRRLLVRPGPDAGQHRAVLVQGLATLAANLGVSSAHATFLPEDEWNLFGEAGYLRRTDQQYHFHNDGYRDFEDFLAALSSRKRKAIRRERRDALADGIKIVHLTGRDITEADWDTFFQFYMDTGSRKWGRPYLNRRFFSLIGERMADRILLVMARRNGRAIAGALNLIGSDALYGRYWGTVEDHPFLHFEVCYYQAIEWGIGHGLARVEAGAQGEHKLARGYRPAATYSAHWIANASFRRAVSDYLEQERRQVDRDSEVLSSYLPFRVMEQTEPDG